MPVDSPHLDYLERIKDWQLMRHVLEGERAVKANGIEYVPRLSDQTDEEFHAYVLRGVFVNATARTHEAHQGLIYRKDPEATVPGNQAAFMSDCTMTGQSFYDYAKDSVREVLAVGRMGTLVDWNMGEESRAYLIPYRAEEILNWKTARIRGRMMLTLLVLQEWSSRYIPETDGPREVVDEYVAEYVPQWRVYRLQTDGPDGLPYVSCQVWRRKKRAKQEAITHTSVSTGRKARIKTVGGPASRPDEWVMIDSSTPTRRGIGLDRIPFIFHGPTNSQPDVAKVPLLDMAHVNLAHFRNSVDLEHGRHITALPTPWITGFNPPAGQKLRLGPGAAWTIDEKEAKVGFLEFTGAGLGALKEGLAEKESQMAGLGARMLEPEAKKAEAYDTVAMRSTGETSVLMQLAISASQALAMVLRLVAWWSGSAGAPEDLEKAVDYQLNTDFLTSRMDPAMLQQLSAAYLAGALDLDSYVLALQKGELVDPDMTPEQFANSIQSNTPGIPMPEVTATA